MINAVFHNSSLRQSSEDNPYQIRMNLKLISSEPNAVGFHATIIWSLIPFGIHVRKRGVSLLCVIQLTQDTNKSVIENIPC